MPTAVTEKERRLTEQNRLEAARFAKIKSGMFKANRFGPLMFALSFGIIGVYFAVMTFAATPEVNGRQVNLTIEPSTRSIKKGQPVVVRVWSDSMDQAVGAVQADLLYPSDKFELTAVDTSLSSYPVDDRSSTTAGRINMRRSTSEPRGLTGRQLVAVVSFQARADSTDGSADMSFSEDSQLLRADDRTNVLQRTDSSRYYVSLLRLSPTSMSL